MAGVFFLDKFANTCYTYTYNKDGNVTKVTESPISGSGTAVTDTCVYEEKSGRLSAKTYGGVGHTYRMIYETNAAGYVYPDNTALGVKLEGKFTDQTAKDGFGRTISRRLTLSGQSQPLLTDTYEYLCPVEANNKVRETGYVSRLDQYVNGTKTATQLYSYDSSGNISEAGSHAVYSYDGLNRLIQEDNYDISRRYVYTYDSGGNITSKKEYTLTGSLVKSYAYGYASSGWKDRLTSFDGQAITYDAIGNPTTYRGNTLTWTNVRRLASYGSHTFSYGADGIRYKKDSTTYTLSGSTILKETNGTRTITYFYGANGVVGFQYNGTNYYYQKNLQGDILAIYDANGTKQAEYVYDAWGKVLSVTNCTTANIGTLNPFRYRSYYYDTETGLYYLQTRYYDPETGRFINADGLDYLGEGEELSNYNLFAYCSNNPVNNEDPEGTLPNWAKIAIGVAAIAIGVIATVASGGAAAPALIAGIKTAVIAGVVSAATSAATSAVKSVVNGDSLEDTLKNAGKAAIDGFCDGFMWGGIMSGASMTYGSLMKKANGIKIGSTAKPQYGKVNIGYGNPSTNGNTLISFQNNAGKSFLGWKPTR